MARASGYFNTYLNYRVIIKLRIYYLIIVSRRQRSEYHTVRWHITNIHTYFLGVFEPCPIFRWALFVWHCFDARRRFPSYETYFNLEYRERSTSTWTHVFVYELDLKFASAPEPQIAGSGTPPDTDLTLAVGPTGPSVFTKLYKRTCYSHRVVIFSIQSFIPSNVHYNYKQ